MIKAIIAAFLVFAVGVALVRVFHADPIVTVIIGALVGVTALVLLPPKSNGNGE
jgi:uncharacterized membrane protein